MKTVTEEIEKKLNDAEILEKARRLATLDKEIRAEDERLNTAKRHHKAQTDDRRLEVERIIRCIASGVEIKEVECSVEREESTGEVLYMHNHEVVKRRAMTEDEFQSEFAV